MVVIRHPEPGAVAVSRQCIGDREREETFVDFSVMIMLIAEL